MRGCVGTEPPPTARRTGSRGGKINPPTSGELGPRSDGRHGACTLRQIQSRLHAPRPRLRSASRASGKHRCPVDGRSAAPSAHALRDACHPESTTGSPTERANPCNDASMRPRALHAHRSDPSNMQRDILSKQRPAARDSRNRVRQLPVRSRKTGAVSIMTSPGAIMLPQYLATPSKSNGQDHGTH